MKPGLFSILCVLAAALASGCGAVNKGDQPGKISREKLADFEKAIAPQIQKARAELPKIKQRYDAGLPSEQTLFVTIRLHKPDTTFEQVFVRVTDWHNDDLLGVIASETGFLTDHKKGELINFKEASILDWVIEDEDGGQEGNYVGKFLEK